MPLLAEESRVRAALPVEVRRGLTREEFEEAMHPPGHPLILAGAMDAWPAMRRWTLEWFQATYGRDRTEVMDALYDTQHLVRVRLAEYLEYVRQPEGTRLQRLETALGLAAPFYAYGYKPLRRHPELLKDFAVPEFVDDWSKRFSRLFQYAHFPNGEGWLFLAPRGATTKLHTDPGATMLWHAQIQGRKRCLLFSPRDGACLYDGAVDPLHPDLERFPLFQRAQPFACVLEPGTMLFLPPNWWHHVVALEPSVTLSYNLVTRVNFGYYVQDRHPKTLARWLKRLPIEPRERAVRKALGAVKARLRARRA